MVALLAMGDCDLILDGVVLPPPPPRKDQVCCLCTPGPGFASRQVGCGCSQEFVPPAFVAPVAFLLGAEGSCL